MNKTCANKSCYVCFREMYHKERFTKLKKGALIVNVAPGEN